MKRPSLILTIELRSGRMKEDRTMKKYEAPLCELLVLSTDILMSGSDENEMALDIFDFGKLTNLFKS